MRSRPVPGEKQVLHSRCCGRSQRFRSRLGTWNGHRDAVNALVPQPRGARFRSEVCELTQGGGDYRVVVQIGRPDAINDVARDGPKVVATIRA